MTGGQQDALFLSSPFLWPQGHNLTYRPGQNASKRIPFESGGESQRKRFPKKHPNLGQFLVQCFSYSIKRFDPLSGVGGTYLVQLQCGQWVLLAGHDDHRIPTNDGRSQERDEVEQRVFVRTGDSDHTDRIVNFGRDAV